MTDQPGRSHAIALWLSPALVVRWRNWQKRRQRERARARRIIDCLANPEPPALMPEREPRTIDDVFVRMIGRPRQLWQAFADDLRTEQRALHNRQERHHGITRAADNLGKFR